MYVYPQCVAIGDGLNVLQQLNALNLVELPDLD